MATVLIDRIEESGLIETTDTYQVKRSYFVSNINSGSSAAFQSDALNDPAIPTFYQSHPSVPLALVKQKQFIPKGDNEGLVVVTYVWDRIAGGGFPITWSVGTSLQQEESCFAKDKTGAWKKMKVFYAPLGAKVAKSRVSIGSVLLPTVTMTATTYKNHSPFQDAVNYTGSVNKSTWATGSAHQWICTGIDGEWLGLNLWRWTYTFAWKEFGWNIVAVVRNPDGSVPNSIDDLPNPPGLLKPGDQGNGWGVFCPYDEIDFSATFGDPNTGY